MILGLQVELAVLDPTDERGPLFLAEHQRGSGWVLRVPYANDAGQVVGNLDASDPPFPDRVDLRQVAPVRSMMSPLP